LFSFFRTAFGFCEFEDPEATLRCMRLLNDWLIADKKLVVGVSDLRIEIQHVCQVTWHDDVMAGVRIRMLVLLLT